MAKVKKIIPSKLETGLQQFLYKHVGPYIPKSMTPNQMTMIGAFGGLFAIICTLLTNITPYFFIGVICGTLLHLFADDLDGYIARSRNMASKGGQYLDLITDIIFSTFLLIALGLSNYCNIKIAIFLVPVYGIIIVTAMHYILHLNEFLFPRLGPIETHICYVAISIGCMIFKTNYLIKIGNLGFKFTDLVMIIAGIPMYYEMIRLQIQLFKRLNRMENNEE